MDTLMITPLGKQDLPEAADVCALAMADNPIHIQVFGPEYDLRHRRLGRFFPGLLAYIHRKGHLYGVVVDGALVGVLGMLPPGSCRPSVRDLVQLLPALLGSTTPPGLLRLATWLRAWAKADLSTRHWHLGPLAVTPSWQHRSMGSHLMEYAIRLSSGDCIYLETDKQANVEFYQRFGFSTKATLPILDTPGWMMVRPASNRH